jgi:rhamnose utilization protein RhaD (predicted bifunctional aldolase and dehydrogenase)/NAD(P)-dependent dehydrogenase (short-subunit alcohol dehydrogenase family)
MENAWIDKDASAFVAKYAEDWGENLALRAYSSRLLGYDRALTLHGGGNVSMKGTAFNALGEEVAAIYVKGSGEDLANVEPGRLTCLDLSYIKRLRSLRELSDDEMLVELLAHRLNPDAPVPSIEALLHAFLPAKFIDHSHPDAILALTNRLGGAETVKAALGDDVAVVEYAKPGFALAKAAADAFEKKPGCTGMVLMKHGLLTWGDTAREAYDHTVSLVTKAEEYAATLPKVRRGGDEIRIDDVAPTPYELARGRYIEIAPILRGALALPSGDPDRPHLRAVLMPVIQEDILKIVDSQYGKEIALTPPLTSDHLIRTKAYPLWIDDPGFGSPEKAAAKIASSIADYAKDYHEYFRRNEGRLSPGVRRLDSMPRAIAIPGMGVVCAGSSYEESRIVRDITESTLLTKAKIFETGEYESLNEEQLFDMEYFALQHRKLHAEEAPLARTVALVTGSAGAIGSGICEGLLANGCHVAITDLPGDALDVFAGEMRSHYGGRVLKAVLDVTDPKSVSSAMDEVIEAWGGVDLFVSNAGVAHVSSLAEMDLEDFRRLQRINVEGTLNLLAEAGRHFKLQGTGGDIVLVSTKNVFSPGAEFGAYSATKAAAHQLARIAGLELAPLGVRVNMVSPDAVFGGEGRKSGLWAEVGPGRMKARGLDEKGLEDYYKNRNLLKAKVTAKHVANAVMFFATRQTPTTGATIPVDGGLPDSTPR